jgi:hypothetical protein
MKGRLLALGAVAAVVIVALLFTAQRLTSSPSQADAQVGLQPVVERRDKVREGNADSPAPVTDESRSASRPESEQAQGGLTVAGMSSPQYRTTRR